MGIQVEGLVKVYLSDDHVANDGISLQVRREVVSGFLGPNGRRESTLVERVMGLPEPTSGTITLGHHDLANPAAARHV